MKTIITAAALAAALAAVLATAAIANESDRSLSPGKADPGGVNEPGWQGNGADNGTRTNGPAGVSG